MKSISSEVVGIDEVTSLVYFYVLNNNNQDGEVSGYELRGSNNTGVTVFTGTVAFFFHNGNSVLHL